MRVQRLLVESRERQRASGDSRWFAFDLQRAAEPRVLIREAQPCSRNRHVGRIESVDVAGDDIEVRIGLDDVRPFGDRRLRQTQLRQSHIDRLVLDRPAVGVAVCSDFELRLLAWSQRLRQRDANVIDSRLVFFRTDLPRQRLTVDRDRRQQPLGWQRDFQFKQRSERCLHRRGGDQVETRRRQIEDRRDARLHVLLFRLRDEAQREIFLPDIEQQRDLPGIGRSRSADGFQIGIADRRRPHADRFNRPQPHGRSVLHECSTDVRCDLIDLQRRHAPRLARWHCHHAAKVDPPRTVERLPIIQRDPRRVRIVGMIGQLPRFESVGIDISDLQRLRHDADQPIERRAMHLQRRDCVPSDLARSDSQPEAGRREQQRIGRSFALPIGELNRHRVPLAADREFIICRLIIRGRSLNAQSVELQMLSRRHCDFQRPRDSRQHAD